MTNNYSSSFEKNSSRFDMQLPSIEYIKASNKCLCAGEINENDYTDNYMMYNLIVIIGLLPVVALFGMFSNVINIYIFTRPRMIASSTVYLTALAGSDFMVVLTGLFMFCLDSARTYLSELTQFSTQSSVWILPVGYMAQTGSVYFTVGAAIDCYFSVCWEPFSRSYCTVTRAKQFVLVILVFTLSYNTVRFWQFFLHECYDNPMETELTVEICATEVYNQVNIVYNVYMYMILMTFLPFILLSILNAFIVHSVTRKRVVMKKKPPQALIIDNHHYQNTSYQLCPTSANTAMIVHGSNSNQNDSPFSHLSDKSSTVVNATVDAATASGDDTVITMVMVVVLFLTCNILGLIINIVETFGSPDKLLLNYMSDTSNFLVVFNSSVNFIIYVMFDRKYRNELLTMRCFARFLGNRRRDNSYDDNDDDVDYVRRRSDPDGDDFSDELHRSATANSHIGGKIRAESTLQTLVSNDGNETAL